MVDDENLVPSSSLSSQIKAGPIAECVPAVSAGLLSAASDWDSRDTFLKSMRRQPVRPSARFHFYRDAVRQWQCGLHGL